MKKSERLELAHTIQGQLEFDLHVVRHQGGVGPIAFANFERQSLDGERARGNGDCAGLSHRQGHHHILGSTFDAEFAGDFILAATQRLEGR